MRVIITGGTGLIGRALANSLAHHHHEVIVLSRNTNKTGGLEGSVQVVKWDGRTAQGWGELINGAGAVVNLAGESIAGEGFPPARWTAERKKRIKESRTNAGAAIMEAIKAAAQKPSVLIQSSAVGIYGVHPFETTITEASPAGNDFLADVCKAWEASTAAAEQMGVRRVIIRTGLVLSSKGGSLPLIALPFQLFAGGPIGSGKQPMPWIHLDDEVAAIRYLIDHNEASGAYNLTAPNPLTNSHFSQALGKAIGRPCWLPAPGFAFKLGFGELSTLLLEGQKALPERLQAAGYTYHYPEAQAALSDLFTNHK
jgi:uncharacterized protein (TIGR01777 family)